MMRFLLLLCAVSAFGQERGGLVDQLVGRLVLKSHPDVVLFCTGDKVYLRPEKVHITDAGVFLGDEFLEIPAPWNDTVGAYLPMGLFRRAEKVRYWICSNQKCEVYNKVVRGDDSPWCPICDRLRTPG